MEKLDTDAVATRLEQQPEWSQNGDAIQRTFSFQDFIEAMAFVNRVAELAEEHQHHPAIMIRYNKVTLTLSTHDAAGLTAKDFDFAEVVDGYVAPA